MLKFRNISFLLTALIALVLASCSTDDATPDVPVTPGTEEVRVRLNIGIEEPQVGGRTRAWSDTKAADGEMMRNWIVVAVKSDGKTIDKVIESENLTDPNKKLTDESGTQVDELEKDYAWTSLEADASGQQHTFYSFANISKADLATAMGFDSADDLKDGATLPTTDNTWTYNVNGNQNSVKGFSNGIPMSNKQTAQVVNGQEVNLEVVRMVAKVKVNITNNSDEALYVPYFSIHDLTAYVAGKPNLKLLPGDIPTGSTKRSINLDGTPDIVSNTLGEYPGMLFTYYDDDRLAAGETKTFTAYVNESYARVDETKTAPNQYFLFDLYTGDDQYVYKDESNYAFGDENESDKIWKTIARNELHTLNITLDKYRVMIDVTAFTAIGVTPSVHDDDTLAVIDLGMYGEFHLTPRVINRATRDTVNNKILLGPSAEAGSPPTMTLDESSNTFGSTSRAPFIWWNSIAQNPLFGLSMGNYGGEAIYTFSASITENGKTYPVSKRIKIRNTEIDFSKLAKKKAFTVPR